MQENQEDYNEGPFMKTPLYVTVKPALDRIICLLAMTLLVITARGAPAIAEAQPQPKDAITVILSTLDSVPVVALGGGLHGRQELDDFTRKLVSDPRFSGAVRNIVFEIGNSLYQPVLDRYIAGEDVPMEQVQLVWRNTTQPFANRAEQKSFLEFVRELNRRLPSDRRIRVLAGDPPIDWAEVRSEADFRSFLGQRNKSFTAVVESQVLAKHQKALLLTGDFHVVRHNGIRGGPTVTMLLESEYPHSTFVIIAHDGFGDRDRDFEPRLAKWPTPSIATMRGTWLGALDPFLVYRDNVLTADPSKIVNPFPGLNLEELADAYLYLGPAASLHEVNLPSDTDPAYARELARRRVLIGRGTTPATPVPTPS
jgi:hypothetical protein